jgi:phage-related protein
VANKVWVAVVPNTKNFASDLRKFLTRIERTLELIVDVRADTRRAEDEVRASIERMSEGTATITVDADTSSAERQINDVTEDLEATVNVDADTGLASTQIAALSRRRKIELAVAVSKSSLASVGTALAALSGARVAQSALSNIGTALSNLDRSVPAISGLALAIGSVGSIALTSVSGILTLGASLAPLVALAAPLPAVLLGGAAAIGVFASAMADAGDQLGSLKPRFAALQDQISSKFWDKAKQPILDLVNGVLPSLRTGLTTIATSLGSWSASVAAAFQAAFDPAIVTNIAGAMAAAISNAATGTDAFAQSIARLGDWGAAYLPGIGQWFSDISGKFNGFIQTVTANGQLTGWVQQALTVLSQLGSTISNTFAIIGNIGDAAAAAGGAGLQNLASALQSINEITSTPIFQGALESIFGGAAEGASGLAGALGPVGQMLLGLVPALSGGLASLGNIAGDLISGIADALNQPAVANGITAAVAGIGQAVQGLLPSLPALGTAFGAVLGVVGQLAGILGPVLGAALSAVAPVITSLALALQPVIAMLGPALVQVIGAVAPIVAQLAAAFMPLAAAILPLLSAALSAIVPLISALAPVFSTLVTALAPLVTALLPLLQAALGLVTPLLIALMPALTALIPPIVQVATVLAQVLTVAFEAITPVVMAVVSAVVPIVESLATVISGVVNVITGLLSGNFSQAWKGAQQIVSGVWSIITSTISGAINIVRSVITAGLNIVRSTVSSVFGALSGPVRGAMVGIGNAVSTGVSAVIAFFQALPGRILGALASLTGLLVNVGRNLMQGFINGVTGFAARMIDAVTAPIRGAISAAKGLLGIHSPSRVFRQIGDYVGQGLERGLKGSASGVKSAARSMTNAVITAFDQKQIKRAQTDQVLTTLARGNGRLVALANQRGSLAARLKAANKSLAAATATRDKYQKSVLESLQGVSVGDSNTGAGAIAALTRQVARTKQFTAVMTQLRKAGLDAVSYQQLIAKGVDALPLATSLLQGGSGQIKQVASLQGQLSKASNSFASSAANDLYGAGVNAAKGLVKGLQSQQAAIAKQMQGIANSMVGSVRKALGIHSPSRVFARDVGRWIPAGIGAGVQQHAGAYEASLDRMLGYVPSASLTRGMALPSGSAAAGAGSTAKTYAPVFQYGGEKFTERQFLNAMHQIEVLTG